MCITPSFVVIGYYFSRYKSLAASLASTGGGLGWIASGPITQTLLDVYGLHGTFLFMAALSSHLFISALLYRPTNSLKQDVLMPMQKSASNYNVSSMLSRIWNRLKAMCLMLKDLKLWMFYLSNMCLSLSTTIVFMHFPELALEHGIKEYEVPFLISISGVGSLCSRLLVGSAVGKNGIDLFTLYSSTLGIIGVTTLLFPLYAATYSGQLVYMILFGVYTAPSICQMTPILMELVGVDTLATAFGINLVMQGVGAVVGPILAGT
jgi:hypothetical protein